MSASIAPLIAPLTIMQEFDDDMIPAMTERRAGCDRGVAARR